jgi:hypothetical protein
VILQNSKKKGNLPEKTEKNSQVYHQLNPQVVLVVAPITLTTQQPQQVENMEVLVAKTLINSVIIQESSTRYTTLILKAIVFLQNKMKTSLRNQNNQKL